MLKYRHIIKVFSMVFLIPTLMFAAEAGAASVSGATNPPVLRIGPQADAYSLTPYMSALLDHTRRMSIDEVSALGHGSDFEPVGSGAINYGLKKAVLWLRFSLAGQPHHLINGHPAPWLIYMNRPLEQHITLYSPDGRGGFLAVDACRRAPCPERTMERMGLFTLPPLSDQPAVYYLRIEADTALLFFPQILTGDAFRKLDRLDTLGQGLYFGICLAMILYNFSVFLSLRDYAYLWYVLYTFFLVNYFGVAHGLSITYLPMVGIDTLIRLDLICLGLSILLTAQFARSFLMTAKNLPGWDRVIRVFMTVAAAVVIMSVWMDVQRLVLFYYVLGSIVPVVNAAPAFVRWRKGFEPARFFVLGYFIFTIGIVAFVVGYGGLFRKNILIFHAFQLGSAFQFFFMALALGDRIRLLRQEKEALFISQKVYERASLIDGLTGVYNRRHFENRLKEEIHTAKSSDRPLSLMIMDVDNFKKFNDTYGHQQGDEVLKHLGELLLSLARKSDIPCRYGGEEFVLILPAADLDNACQAADRLRLKFYHHAFQTGDNQEVHASISIGLAQYRAGDTKETLVQRADTALYEAKRSGKNCFCPA